MQRIRANYILLVAALATMIVNVAYAFDVAVYFDPRSFSNWLTVNPNSGCGDRNIRISHILYEQDYYNALNEMGVTHLIPVWPFPDDFSDMAQLDLGHLRILNNAFPMDAGKYLECQYRMISMRPPEGNLWDYINDDTPHELVTFPPSGVFNDTVWQVQAENSITMWRPQSPLGIWKGWKPGAGQRSSDEYMPMHFEILCNLNVYDLQDTTSVATVYWYVGEVLGDEQHWWRYPAQIIRVNDFVTSTFYADTIRFTIDPHPNENQLFQRCDSDFAIERDQNANEHSFYFEGSVWGAPVRLEIDYHGHNFQFQIRQIRIWDEGYHQLFEDPETYRPALDSMLADSFRAQLQALPQHMIGWYYDEWQQSEMYSGWIEVNEILQNAGLPQMHLNGHHGWEGCSWCPRNVIMDSANAHGVDLPVFMHETYFVGASDTCRPRITFMSTDSSSDVDYLDASFCYYAGPDSAGYYQGHRSLQCAIDQFYLSEAPYYTRYDIRGDTSWHFEISEQVKQVHNVGKKFWAMVACDEDDPNDESDPDACCSIRVPTAGEIKLAAWMAVACDADGILWYPVALGSGLFEWTTSSGLYESADWCDNTNGIQGGNDAWVEPDATGRFAAARDVNHKIQRIAPLLDPLKFERTYASRAFEQNYGTSDDDWIKTDSLALTSRGSRSYVELFNTERDQWYDRYIQISRFMTPGLSDSAEDYWFLIINRRAQPGEERTVHVHIKDIEDINGTYVAEGILSGRMLDVDDWIYPNLARRTFSTGWILPGDAELVHFYKADTSDWVINEPDTIYAPIYLHRNIIIDTAGSLTILPNLTALKDSFLVNSTWHHRWDSVATVTFWEGKGLTYRAMNFGSKLHVLGNDSIQIRFQAANTDKPWAGIKVTESYLDSIYFRNTIIQGATSGLMVERGFEYVPDLPTQDVTLDHCIIRDCHIGLDMTSRAHVSIYNSDIADNYEGVWVFNSVLRMDTCRILNNEHRGLLLGTRSEGRFVLDSLMYNGDASLTDSSNIRAGIFTSALSVLGANQAELKCCYIGKNTQAGIGCYNSTITMANPGSSAPTCGWNEIVYNDGYWQIVADQSVIILDNGHNTILGSNPNRPQWIYAPNITSCPRFWTNNHWGTSDYMEIQSHLPSDVTFWPILSVFEDCPETSQEDTDDENVATFMVAKNYVQTSEFDSAKLVLQELVSDADLCPIGRSAIKEIIVTDIEVATCDESVDFFRTLADTTTIRDIQVEARLAQAWSLAYSNQMDSCAVLMQALLDSAATDTERVQVQIELLTLDLLQQSVDSMDEVTFAELKSVVDSIDYLLMSLNVWTQTDIYDTVVMYAPCTVREDVLVHPGGRLEVKPYPGIQWPEVTMENGSMLDAMGYGGQAPRGEVIIQGMADCPVIIRSDSGGMPIFAPSGLIDMKHVKLFGDGVATEVYQLGPKPIIRIDSCEFSLFSDGLWIWNTDSTSYIRNSEFFAMGEGVYYGPEFGACILLIDGAYLQIENCNIHDGEGLGILNYYGSNANVLNTSIENCYSYGVLNWEGSTLSMECCALTDNGDTLPELWSTDGLVDLVGSHNEFSDSLGTLLYSADPSYVDLEDGECYFNLRSEYGLYLKSGDTTDIWDITLNTWNPAIPTDSNFYNLLYPPNPAKWAADTSLADFIACSGEGAAMSISGNPSYLIIGDGEAGACSIPQGDEEATAKSSSDGLTKAAAKGVSDGGVAARSQADATKAATKRVSQRQLYRERHHREQEQWRQIKELSSSGDRMAVAEATKRFVSDNPASELVPAALVKLSGLAGENKNTRISDFLKQQEKSLADPTTRSLARRLSYVSLAKEGNPREALAGLEEMMETAETPRDSIQALVSAMGVYYFDNPGRKIQPRFATVRNDNIKQLTRRVIQLARVLDDPDLATDNQRAAIPTEYRLYQNYPNPFNPITDIRFDLPEVTRVELKVFNILGQEVAKLVDEVRPAGVYQIQWDSKSNAGIPVASGVYVYQLKAGGFVDARKMILLR